MAAKKKKAAKGTGSKNRKKTPLQEINPYQDEIIVVIALVAAILLALSTFNLCGAFGSYIGNFLFGVLGILAYVFPYVLFMGVATSISNRGNRSAQIKIGCCVGIYVVMVALSHMIAYGYDKEAKILDFYEKSMAAKAGGGILGSSIAMGLSRLFGQVGTYVILIGAAIGLLILITEKLLFAGIREQGRRSKERLDAYRAERQAYREQLEIEEPLEYEYEKGSRRKAKVVTFSEEDKQALKEMKKKSVPISTSPKGKVKFAVFGEDRVADKPKKAPAKKKAKQKQPESPAPEAVDQAVSFSDVENISVFRGDPAVLEEMTITRERLEEVDPVFQKELEEKFGSSPKEPLFAEPLFIGNDFVEEPWQEDFFPDIAEEIGMAKEKKEAEVPKRQEEASPQAREAEGEESKDRREESSVGEEIEKTAEADLAEEIEEGEAGQAEEEGEKGKGELWEKETEENNSDAEIEKPALVEAEPDRAQGAHQGEAAWEEAEEKSFQPKVESEGKAWEEGPLEEPEPKAAFKEAPAAFPGGQATEVEKRAERKSGALEELQKPGMAPESPKPVEKKPHVFPSTELLSGPKGDDKSMSDLELKNTAIKLKSTLESFGVRVEMKNISCGPRVTRYELQPAQGVKVSKITSLTDDIKLSLAAADIRIEAPIPGKAAVGIEVPNTHNTMVMFRSLLESQEFKEHKSNIAFAVGKDIGGKTVVADIAKMPHLLIAGATGSGKSVCINTLIMSILYKADPEEVKLIMVDPKVVELSIYNGIPHLLIPVVTDPKKASGALNWAVMEMTDRYNKFAELGVRDLKSYNEKVKVVEKDNDERFQKLPQIVIIVDELADLMMVAPGEVEDAICRLAQLARAAGLHLIIATQRPSVNVITGLIKANIPSRIAFAVSSAVDSRTIIDGSGAEKLLGNGDMLFFPSGYPKPVRVQGSYVSDQEVTAVVEFLKEQNGDMAYNAEVASKITATASADSSQPGGGSGVDEHFAEAGRFIIERDKASIGVLQRVFKVGYNRAARIMDQLYEAGVVGPEEGTKPRKVIMSMEEFEQYIDEYI